MMIGASAINTSSEMIGSFCTNGPKIADESSVWLSSAPTTLSDFESMLIIITEKIAPVEVIPTNPKLSVSDDLLSFFSIDTPTAIANINGTVKAPVVAPDASKDIARNSGDVNNARTNIKP